MVVDGRAQLLPRDQPTVSVRKITPDYLAAMGIPLLRGRDVSQTDTDVLLSAARPPPCCGATSI